MKCMKFRKLITFFTLAVFFTAAVVCCCLPQTASANISSQEMSCCHKSHSQTTHQNSDQSSKVCPHYFLKAISNDSSDLLSSKLGQYFFSVDLPQGITSANLLPSLHSHAPPQYASVIPLYLKNSILRI